MTGTKAKVTTDWVKPACHAGRIARIEAYFSGHGYEPHRHDAYAIGRTLAGVQSFNYRGSKRHSLQGMTMVLVKIQGDFIWHSHADTDEAFIVIEGTLRIDFRDRAVFVQPGELFVVPKGVEHKTAAETITKLMMIEPRGVLNTGDEGGERTAENNVWI